MAIENRNAYHNYFILDTIQAGLELQGSEVKSVRAGKMNITDSFVKLDKGEIFLVNANISQYDKTSAFAPDPRRTRKLLMHKSQISKLEHQTKTKGYALIPLKVYFVHGLAKVDVGVAKGKKLYDKKESLKIKDSLRQADRDIKAAKLR